MKKSLAIAAIALALGGCSSVSEVTPTGPNSYMVGSSARGGMTSNAEVKALAVRRAQEFCAQSGKMAEVTDSSSSGIQMWTPQNAEVQFKCVAH